MTVKEALDKVIEEKSIRQFALQCQISTDKHYAVNVISTRILNTFIDKHKSYYMSHIYHDASIFTITVYFGEEYMQSINACINIMLDALRTSYEVAIANDELLAVDVADLPDNDAVIYYDTETDCIVIDVLYGIALHDL